MDVVSIGKGARLRVDAALQWAHLLAAAKAAGVTLAPSGPLAGYRTAEEQAALARKLGTYGQGGLAAPVGRSRHQLGIALDVANVTPGTPNVDAPARLWLLEHGPGFGWHPVGTRFRTAEPWHFEWVEPGAGWPA